MAPSRTRPVVRKILTFDQRAKVFSAEGTAANTFFSLPQVQLANLTAARRINYALVEYFNGVNGATLAGTAQQAVRLAEIQFHANGEQGFRGYEYEVLYNGHEVLSLALNITELGEHEHVTNKHVTFDLRTGRQLVLADLIADTTALQRSWRQQVNERTAQAVADAAEYFGKDTTNLAYLKELVNWDERASAVVVYPEPEFAVTAGGLSLFRNYDLPLPWSELKPQEEYLFTWGSLRPWWKVRGHWRTLIISLPHHARK